MNIKPERKAEILKEFNKYVKRRCFRKAISLAKYYKIKGVLISKGTIKKNYALTNKQINRLQYVEIDNPHYKCAGAMKLYLIKQVEHVMKKDINVQLIS